MKIRIMMFLSLWFFTEVLQATNVTLADQYAYPFHVSEMCKGYDPEIIFICSDKNAIDQDIERPASIVLEPGNSIIYFKRSSFRFFQKTTENSWSLKFAFCP